MFFHIYQYDSFFFYFIFFLKKSFFLSPFLTGQMILFTLKLYSRMQCSHAESRHFVNRGSYLSAKKKKSELSEINFFLICFYCFFVSLTSSDYFSTNKSRMLFLFLYKQNQKDFFRLHQYLFIFQLWLHALYQKIS